MESLNYYFGSREAGMLFMNSSSRDAFIALNTCCLLVGSVPDEGVASSSVHFFSPIYTVLLPHISLISSLLIIERDKERDRRFVTSWF